MYTTALILAAGVGSRMGSDKTKQTMNILGKSVLRRAVEPFEACRFVNEIILVCREDEFDFAKTETAGFSKVTKIVSGGKTRAESAINGFSHVGNKECGYVLIHDAARCLITCSDIEKIANAAYEHGCATASNLVSDTVKTVDESCVVTGTVPRVNLRTVQTPQAFENRLYSKAIESIGVPDESITDDNMLMERIGVDVYAVQTDCFNIKITNPSDIAYAEFIIGKREKNT